MVDGPTDGVPLVLCVAGSDCGAGAGIQADLKTCAALGGYAFTVVSAVTAQNTVGVHHVEPVSIASFQAQLQAVFDDFAVGAVKVGMIPTPEHLACLDGFLRARPGLAVVMDPVIRASTGAALSPGSVVTYLLERFLPRVDVLTPNLPELGRLAALGPSPTEAALHAAARDLCQRGAGHVLLKGGHGAGDEAVDWLISTAGAEPFSGPRRRAPNDHGTGCTLASAIATELARGTDLRCAVGKAKTYVATLLAGSSSFDLGFGAGPLDHFAGGAGAVSRRGQAAPV